MKVHVIVDFMHIYYKYFYEMKAGKLRRLSSAVSWNGTTIEKDTSLIYYPLKDIEKFRKSFEADGHDVTVSVCFDCKSVRKEADTEESKEYKSNRTNKLSDEDKLDIEYIEKCLRKAGYNVYKVEGYEADDLVSYMVRKFNDKFDYSIIYTNDKDLLVNVGDKVNVMRFKQTVGYSAVAKSNYEGYLAKEFKVRIPYNAIGLYLASVGDSSDKIKGITKFGPKAFEKLLIKLDENENINWVECGDYEKMREVIEKCRKYLDDRQFEELQSSFNLVANVELNCELPEPIEKSTEDKRRDAYSELNMFSLIS